MGSQHHFVVVFNTNTKEWSWDPSVEEDHFSGTILLDEGTWVSSGYSESINDTDTEASETLCKMLRIMNGG